MSRFDMLIVDVHLATMTEDGAPYGQISNGAMGLTAGRIEWIGAAAELSGDLESQAGRIVQGGGGWLTPGLIDCHTHLVFGGDRVDEFERRLLGESYEQIARAGGGIRSTVRSTREASAEVLRVHALRRLARLVAEGVTTVEIKSGYGLELEAELKMLRVARSLGRSEVAEVQTTLLAAHALPEEFEGRRAEYLALVREEMIPRARAEGLADAVDAFCEGIAFDAEECAGVFRAALDHDLPVRLHADQLSDGGGAALAARFGARSADHLEHCSEEGAAALAEAGTTAVLLPGAFYFLRDESPPPVETFRRLGVPIGLGTDANPGSSPALSLLLMLNMACVLFRMTPEEALAGVTRVGARALGLAGDRGTLEVGKRADLALWDIESPAELCYWMGANPLKLVVKNGVPRTPSEATAALS